MFDPQTWDAVPFSFWAVVFFVLGSMVGSLLNVCIHRMPRGESIVRPASHCPHCRYAIPWYLNIPLFTWLYLRGRCANCGAPISVRYFLVELLTGVAFLCAWLSYGLVSPALAAVYCVLLAGLIAATFIDLEHFIIPDEITLGGMAAGFLASALVPLLHRTPSATVALERSGLGMLVGAGIIYAILRLGKLVFGRQRFDLAPDSKVVFTETSLRLPAQEIPYDELFYRKSDAVMLFAKRVELIDRCYRNARVRLTPSLLLIDGDPFVPEQVTHLEVVTDQITVPREAMGLGDVKFMAAIGAFLGWPAVIFSLMLSSIIGATVGVVLIVLRRQEWSSRLPYGPYIALAATVWIFFGERFLAWWVSRL
jgi:leader peptidase (prepilin peptidase) / N-methyltransferase